MSFSEHYFSRYPSLPPFFDFSPDKNLGIIVVIPCYDDDFIFTTLSSLENAKTPESAIEVIVVVNSAENTPTDIAAKNKHIFEELKAKSETGFYKQFRLLPILIENVPKKTAGVGNARKTGMDEAVRRFSAIDKANGIIVSLDADSLVGKDYFKAIENAFGKHIKSEAFTLQFEHNFDSGLYSEAEIRACRLYETYLRYYKLALASTGFPYYFHTIGSCFAVTASAYIKCGGMPRRQGGEDFYFLHKLVQMTEIGAINETLVFPAPRISDRVPFGTGPTVRNIIANGDYYVYNFGLFAILKRFFDTFETISTQEDISLDGIPKEIINFAGEKNLLNTLRECKRNAKQGKNLKKRLYSKFDAFFVIKFLNSFQQSEVYPPTRIAEATKLLLDYYSTKAGKGLSFDIKKDMELITKTFTNL